MRGTTMSESHEPEELRVRVFGACACLGGVVCLERSITGDLVLFALGATLVGVGYCAARFPRLFWTPRAPRAERASEEERDVTV